MFLKKEYIGTALIGVWKIEESIDTLLAMLTHTEWLADILSIKSESRIREMLASRVLLKELCGDEKQVAYLPSGKPFLSGESFYISISHTKGYAAVVIDSANKVSIDVELISDKVKRVQSRIVSDREYIDLQQEVVHLLLHWSSKETIFKMLEREGVNFISDLFIHHFTPSCSGIFQASESRTESNRQFDIHYRVEDDYVLTALIAE